MPRRLILFILIFTVVLLFVAFNLTNKCDINFGFISIKDTPVFFTVFASFFLGMLCTLPFVISARSKKNRLGKQDKKHVKLSGLKKGGDSASPEYSDRKIYGID